MYIHGLQVKGAIDTETRCIHYHTEKDRIAIKFYCCQEYFPCYECHREHGCGNPAVWQRKNFAKEAILCGGCGVELSVTEYLSSNNECPLCQSAFNPGCSLHSHLYFSVR